MLYSDSQNIKLGILKSIDFFLSLSEADLIELANMSVVCNYEKGNILYNEGDLPEFVYILSKGRVKSFCCTRQGRTIIANISRDLIGLQNVVSGNPRWLSGEAMDDICVLKISRNNFLAFIEKRPELLIKILKRAENTMNNLFNRLSLVVDCTAEQRVIEILFALYKKFGSNLPFRIIEIASLAGLTRETTIRVISHLKNNKVVKVSRNKITIIDPDNLNLLKQYQSLI